MTRPRPPRSLLDLQRSLGDFLARFVPEGERVALGVSGGADSLALLQAAARLARRDKRPPWKFLAIHVDHGVRPDSAEDAAFVRERCAALSVDCAIETRQASPGASEESLRELRYAAFAEAMTQAGARFLALAHHRDDQAETLLHRLIRGTGPEGLAGMAPQTERGGLILLRPFLDLSREDLRAILAREGISWREDASNADARFTRNRVRGELIPLLQDAFNPRVAERLADLARQCDADRAYWARQIEGRLAGEEMYPDALRLDWLATTPAALQSRLLLYWLSDLTKFLPPNIRREQPGRVHVEDLASFFPSAETGASIETANGFRVRREASWLRALAPGTDAPPLNMIGGVVIERPIPLEPNAMLSLSGGRRLSGKEWAAPRHLACDLLAPGEPPTDKEALLMPESLFRAEKLVVRRRREGDRLASLGPSAGSSDPPRPGRKLKDILERKQIPRDWRDYLPVIAGESGVWLIPGWLAPPKGLCEQKSAENCVRIWML